MYFLTKRDAEFISTCMTLAISVLARKGGPHSSEEYQRVLTMFSTGRAMSEDDWYVIYNVLAELEKRARLALIKGRGAKRDMLLQDIVFYTSLCQQKIEILLKEANGEL